MSTEVPDYVSRVAGLVFCSGCDMVGLCFPKVDVDCKLEMQHLLPFFVDMICMNCVSLRLASGWRNRGLICRHEKGVGVGRLDSGIICVQVS